jgi:3-oxoacyl-[acyl-carrier-protein] synthase II
MIEKNRVVITGLGAVTPGGIGVKDTWESLIAGRSSVHTITRFDASDLPTQFAAEVTNFDPADYMDFRAAKRTARFAQFATVATDEAIRNAALDLSNEDMSRVGIEMGTAIGGVNIVEEQAVVFHEKGYRRVNPTLIPIILANSGACTIAINLGIKGPTQSPVAACATGVVSIGHALRYLQSGEVDVMLAGGSEAATSPLALATFSRVGVLSTRNDAPEQACRPFDAQRDGTVMGEGAAMVVLETLEHAQRRGAPILAEVLGYSLTEDAYHISAPDPSGDGAARAMTLALKDAGVPPDEIDYVVPHGTGTQLNDAAETTAMKISFGEAAYRVAISSNKSMLGHMLGAAGAISAVVAVQALCEGLLPPTINLDYPDPHCDLDYVPNKARQANVQTAMVNAFGFGGQNASLIIREVKA